MYEDNFTAFEDGNYSTSFDLDNDAEPGTYNTTVTSGEETTFTLFMVESVEPENTTSPKPEELENVTAAMVLGEDEYLGNSIERARDYLGRLEEMLESLRDEHTGNDDVQGNLTVIYGYIETAGGYLTAADEAEDHKDAVRYYAAARNLMGRIKGLLTSVFKTHKIDKTEKFAKQVESRIEGLASKIEKLQGSLANGPEALAAFNGTKLKLNNVMKYINSGNMTEALDYLETVVAEIDYNLDNMNGTETATQFKNMYKLEAKIQVLEKKALKLQRKGLDVSGVLSSIYDTESQLNQINGNLEKGNKNKGVTGAVGSGNGNNSKPKKDVMKRYEKPKKEKDKKKDEDD